MESGFFNDLTELHRKYLSLTSGKVADYIPELSRVDPNRFAICVTDVDGKSWMAGDAESLFTLQSVSKPFVYGLALENHGSDFVHTRVGHEPTGDAFNSIIRLEETSHRPHNPMINTGAIAITHLVPGKTPAAKTEQILALFSRYAGRPLSIDEAVFLSEKTTGHRNRAIAHLLRNFGIIDDEIEDTLDLYFRQCSVMMNVRDLSMMGATLARGGVQPVTGDTVLSKRSVRHLLSLMFSCGMYDSSGLWAHAVGIPSKSGVSGAILGVVPGRMGIAVYSPPLDAHGHSVRGVEVFRELSERWNLGIFDSPTGG